MPEYSPPPNRGGNNRLEERVHRLEERVHQLSNDLSLANYKHTELEKDFHENRKRTSEGLKWGWLAFVGFLGSIVIPLAIFFVTISTKGSPSP